MRIAILGAGFAGLATVWHILENNPSVNITVFDSLGIGGGASGVSAGLLHPYTGVKAKKDKRGASGVQSTIRLLNEASETLGMAVFKENGLLRLARNPEQEKHFQECARLNDEVHWLETKECQGLVPGISELPGIFIEKAISVYPELYMEGLWKACQSKGAIFNKKSISSLSEVGDYDLIICCLGGGYSKISELANLPLSQLKGQILELPWPDKIPLPKISMSSEVYLVMSKDNKSCFVGSTFERNFSTISPDIDVASATILPKLHAMIPAFKGTKPIDCRAGIRITAPNREPFFKKISDKVFVFTGLGSKGLLHHSVVAKELIDTINL